MGGTWTHKWCLFTVQRGVWLKHSFHNLCDGNAVVAEGSSVLRALSLPFISAFSQALSPFCPFRCRWELWARAKAQKERYHSATSEDITKQALCKGIYCTNKNIKLIVNSVLNICTFRRKKKTIPSAKSISTFSYISFQYCVVLLLIVNKLKYSL